MFGPPNQQAYSFEDNGFCALINAWPPQVDCSAAGSGCPVALISYSSGFQTFFSHGPLSIIIKLTDPHVFMINLKQIEEKIFANNKELLPKLYLRYIDDVYAVFDCDDGCLKFLEVLNSQHKDIRFTVEKATTFSTLNFLDVQIKLLDNGYETCVWRKPTNTGVLLNFNAICDMSYFLENWFNYLLITPR